MKAAVLTEYGDADAVKVQTVQKPVPRQNQVLVKIHATTVCSGDWRVMGPNVPFGFGCIMRCVFGCCSPRRNVLGQEFAGVVEEVGANVTEFQVGDEVFGTNDINFGAHAEYMTIAADFALIKKPSNMGMCESATIPFGGVTSLYFMRDLAQLKDGENVLINGASGCLGTFGIQIAKIISPTCKVTAICSGKNEELVRRLGADEFIDYNKQDFTQQSVIYDVIYDTVGNINYSAASNVMSKQAIFMTAAPEGFCTLWKMLLNKCYCCGSKKFTTGTPSIGTETKADLEVLKKWIEEEKLKTVIDSNYSLDDIQDAFRLVASGHKKGSAVVVCERGKI